MQTTYGGYLIYRNNEPGRAGKRFVGCTAIKKKDFEDKDDAGVHGATPVCFLEFIATKGELQFDSGSIAMVTSIARSVANMANQRGWDNERIQIEAKKRHQAMIVKLRQRQRKAQQPAGKRSTRGVRPSHRMQRVAV